MKTLFITTILLWSICLSGRAQLVPIADTISLDGIDRGRGWEDDAGWTRRYDVASTVYTVNRYGAPFESPLRHYSKPEFDSLMRETLHRITAKGPTPNTLYCAQTTWDSTGPKAATRLVPQVLSMVRNMPFPFAVGMAMDTPTYSAIKKNQRAAQLLRQRSEAAIDSLKSQISATQKVLDDQKALTRHDSTKAKSFSHQADSLQTTLGNVQDDLKKSDEALADLYIALPRVLRYSLKETDPYTIGKAAANYMGLQRKRKWYWGAIALASGTLTGLILKR